jgi:hypothetical protein
MALMLTAAGLLGSSSRPVARSNGRPDASPSVAPGVSVPVLIGVPVARARVALVEVGLRVGRISPTPGVPGRIVHAVPVPGTSVVPGTRVSLWVGVLRSRFAKERGHGHR